MYIDGQWLSGAASFGVFNPANGEQIGTAPEGTRADAAQAIAVAAAAFPGWSSRTAYERSDRLYRAWEIMMSRRDELARLMTAEQGKPLKTAQTEVKYAADFLLWFAEEAKRVYGEIIPSARAVPGLRRRGPGARRQGCGAGEIPEHRPGLHQPQSHLRAAQCSRTFHEDADRARECAACGRRHGPEGEHRPAVQRARDRQGGGTGRGRAGAPAMRIYREETFGPVAPVIPFDDEQQAIAMANDTHYGLASYVYTQNLARAMRVFEALQFGMVGVNDINPTSAAAPFGGIKHSGLGREGAREGIEEYLQTKLGGFSI